MDLVMLLSPIEGSSPTGVDCSHTPELRAIQELALFVVQRSELDEVKRSAKAMADAGEASSEKTIAESSLSALEAAHRLQGLSVKEILNKKDTDPDRAALALEAKAVDILARRTKDFRVACALTVAALKLRGLAGLLEGLALLNGLNETFPDSVFPVDEDDPSDDSARALAFSELSAGVGVLALLRDTTLAVSRVGRITFRDIEVIEGNLIPDPFGGSVTNDEHLLAIFKDQVAEKRACKLELVANEEVAEHIRSVCTELSAAAEAFGRIERSFRFKARGEARLRSLIERMNSHLLRHMDDLKAEAGRAMVNSVVNLLPHSRDAATSSAVGSAVVNQSSSQAALAAPRMISREDIRLDILKLATLLEGLEPSHPSSLFLRRAAHLLAAKSFFDIVKELIPDSAHHIETLTGQKMPEESSVG